MSEIGRMPASLEAAPHPWGRGNSRVELGERHRDVTVAAVARLDRDGVATAGRMRRDRGRIAVGHAIRRRELAGDASHRQRITAVGVDREVEHLVTEPEDFDDVGAQWQ